ncbi:SRPBCC domain-containing protein [Sphingomonas sp. 2R-10]|uniref:SRPBCC domain-containing protein n=1 Tax=Sphingomonas sp. 2R-10 TaxID=3045148 RepID=UPI000F7ACD6D|nr:SRPBCC domain-containing protein [Sphingomonas sp. 2R-10]MDJ0278575.1 SRPBCC domain-containing protein [Sphingomonas sp. 2R-10]
MTDEHELAIERRIAAPIDLVWRAWTQHLPKWWAPRPWTTELLGLDLHPGGRFATTMRGPGGEEMTGEGVILDVVPHERIVFTNALRPGWHPQPQQLAFVGAFTFAEDGGATLYRAAARHWDAETAKMHAEMGFEGGWAMVAQQLEAVAVGLD